MVSYDDDADLLARTAWGEARGEGVDGMQAVINVIMNRVNAGSWWGRTVKDVVLYPKQFSCWYEDDPNYAKLLAVTADDTRFAQAHGLAKLALDGVLKDITGGATHYHSSLVRPSWADPGKKVATVGGHIFYKGIA